MARVISYRVTEVHDDTIVVWDGESMVDRSTPGVGRSTMTLPIERTSVFEVGDIVDLVVVLRERPES